MEVADVGSPRLWNAPIAATILAFTVSLLVMVSPPPRSVALSPECRGASKIRCLVLPELIIHARGTGTHHQRRGIQDGEEVWVACSKQIHPTGSVWTVDRGGVKSWDELSFTCPVCASLGSLGG